MLAAVRSVLLGTVDPFPGAVFGAEFTRNRYKLSGLYTTPANIPGWSFSRSSAGTALDSAGNVISFATGVPRITDKGLLVEEARTNLCLQSQTFDNAAWTKGNCGITADAVVAPDGTLTADTVTVSTTASSTLAIAGGSRPAVTGTTCTASVYVKRVATVNATASFVLRDATAAADKITGTLTWATMAMAGSGASITRLGSTDWYRVVLTDAAWTSTNQAQLYAGMAGASYTIGHAYAVWGAQIEAGAFPTSYIPTTTASATRAADVSQINPVSPNTAEGTLLVEAMSDATPASVSYAVIIQAASSNDSFSVSRNTTPQVRAQVFGNGTSRFNVLNTSWPNGTVAKVGVSYKAGDYKACFNAGTVATGADASSPIFTSAPDRIYVGCQAGASWFNGYVRKVIYYPRAFSSGELQAATA